MVQASHSALDWPLADADHATRTLVQLFRVVRGVQALTHSPVDLGSRRLLGTLAQTGPIRLSDLAHESQLDLSTVSRHVTGLAADGLLSRAPDPSDGRACVVGLTDAGRRRLHELIAERAAAIQPVLDRWPEGDVEVLLTLLTRLAEDLLLRSTTNGSSS